MIGRLGAQLTQQNAARLSALDASQAVIEFDPHGDVLAANENFLVMTGYELGEIVGRPHAMFLERDVGAGREQDPFWDRLRSGAREVGQFKRCGRDGREIWIEASYNPITDRKGRLTKIVMLATEITARKTSEADHESQIAAIDRAYAVISFGLDGRVLAANRNFLATMGYSAPEVVGEHHRMFMVSEDAAASDYESFWQRLRAGEHISGQVRRQAKSGAVVWLEATYSPILDASGRPYKVVKYASDITKQMCRLADLKRLIGENLTEVEVAVECSRTQASGVTSAATQTAGDVGAVALASEALAASVGAISERMTTSRTATEDASTRARTAQAHTRTLTDAAAAMGGIVGLIQSIAERINLLALNATIEASRAGEAGLGFAVVAREVKDLASQAARATDKITREIDAVQAISEQVAGSLEAIGVAVESVRGQVLSTADEIERQNAMTRDIATSMSSAAAAVSNVTEGMVAITSSVDQVAAAVGRTKRAAMGLIE